MEGSQQPNRPDADQMGGSQQPNRSDADPMSGSQQPNALGRDAMQSNQEPSDRQARDQQARDQQARDQQARDQQVSDQQVSDQQARDQQVSDQQANQHATVPVGHQFVQGTPVYDINGAKVGTVSEHGVQRGYLVIHHGLLRDDIYIPLDMIQGSDANGVALNMTKQEVDMLPVNRPPAGNTPATPDI
jgi:hypothetical protein